MLNHLKENLSKKYKIASFNEKESGYTNLALMFGGLMSRKLYFVFELPYTPIKANGDEGKEKKFKQNVFFAYCPFCGKPYPEEKDDSKPVSEE